MSSTTSFRPHGLIKNQIQQQFYNNAHLANVFTGIADPKEHATVALMEVILYRNIFTEDHFAVTSEQPPSPDSQRRCDLVVNYLEEGCERIRTFCFAECKRTKKSQAFSLKALEDQAMEYCKLYVEHEDVSFVYAATMAGAHVRLWKYMQGDDGLTPFWGDNNEGDWQEYKDIGVDDDSRTVEESFNHMKNWTPTPHAGQTINNYTSYQPAIPSFSNSANRYVGSSDNPAETTTVSSGYKVDTNAITSGPPSSSTQNQWAGASDPVGRGSDEMDVYEGTGGGAPGSITWQEADEMDVHGDTGGTKRVT